jgi:prevent-host-death family protein
MPEQSEAGVRELKSKLSAYLRRVKAGETVVITERGQPIGRIVPVIASTEERLEQLCAAGIVAWNGLTLIPLTPLGKTTGPQTVADLLLEDRE